MRIERILFLTLFNNLGGLDRRLYFFCQIVNYTQLKSYFRWLKSIFKFLVCSQKLLVAEKFSFFTAKFHYFPHRARRRLISGFHYFVIFLGIILPFYLFLVFFVI